MISEVPAVSASDDADGRRLALRGRFSLDEAGELWSAVRHATVDLRKGQALAFDVSGVESIDGGAMALLVQIRAELASRGVNAEFTGADTDVAALIALYQGNVRARRRIRRRKPEGFLSQVGRGTLGLIAEAREMLGFFGATLLAMIGLLKEPRTGNWRDIVPTLERVGVDAVPIVVLINFLVGFVLAFQGAIQLKQFGANIFVADLVGLSVVREMGPLMTAIILCGRTGAAYAAELGSMKVAEEIDALRTMGFGPIRYLVFPRLFALLVAMPVLTLIGDLMGMLGGLVVGVTSLNLTVQAYLLETQRALTAWDVMSGVAKSGMFAIAIALISCQQGFAAAGGAEGVGRRTTTSVVAILLALILLDSAFTMFFQRFGL